MKLIQALLPILIIVAGSYSAPSNVPEADLTHGNDRVAGGSSKDNKLPPKLLLSDQAKSDHDDSSAENQRHSPMSEQNLHHKESIGETENLSYNSLDGSVGMLEYSASFPSWTADELLNSADDVSSKGMSAGDIIIQGLESRLVNEKLEPLYKSISHLRSLLFQLREKATVDLQHLGESISDEGEYSYDYLVGQSYLSSAGQDNNMFHEPSGEGDAALKVNTPAGQEDIDGQKETTNIAEDNHKNKAIEASMADFHEQPTDTMEPGQRVKRDLGWGFGDKDDTRFKSAEVDADIYSSVFEDAEGEESWVSSSAKQLFAQEERNSATPRVLKFRQRVQVKPRKDTNWRNLLLNLEGRMNVPSQTFDRRRRYREDLRTFANSLPTLEGMRKRTATVNDPDDEPVVPNPGPPYPIPPNLPPPDNVIHSFLRPEETLPLELPPDFEEDNAQLEEQTNGVEMTNPYQKRYEYLKDVERSIMMEPLEDLAVQLAGRNALIPDEALRVRRVMQIPPPPPYGRKVVKSLYRKKAYGFPFVDDEIDNGFLPNSWDISDADRFSSPYGDDAEDRFRTPHSWDRYMQGGHIEEPNFQEDIGGEFQRLFAAMATKEAKDQILEHLLAKEDIPSDLRREVLIQALMEEADSSDNPDDDDSTGFQVPDSEPHAGREWGEFQPDEDGAISTAGRDVISTFDAGKMATEGGEWESPVAPEDEGFFSVGSESEASVPGWGTVNDNDEFQSNIPRIVEEMKRHILMAKLTEILHDVTNEDN